MLPARTDASSFVLLSCHSSKLKILSLFFPPPARSPPGRAPQVIKGLGLQDEFPLIMATYDLSFVQVPSNKESFATALQAALVKSGKLSEVIAKGGTTADAAPRGGAR